MHLYEHRADKNVENDFKKDFFKLMNNAVFGNTIEDVRKHRYIKLVLPGARRNYLVSETDYHTIIFFSENLLKSNIHEQTNLHRSISIRIK